LILRQYAIKNPDTAIIGFVDDFEFLHPHYNSKLFDFNEYKFRNVESAFQSQRNNTRMQDFELLEPNEAIKLASQIHTKKNWLEIQDSIMYNVNLAKFTQDKTLKRLLKKTKNRELIYLSNDMYWGMKWDDISQSYIGQNMLGVILMQIRIVIK
jgi:ribA/ribD-fused uncharacterized protein